MARVVGASKLRLHRRRRRIIVAALAVGVFILLLATVVGLTWLPFLRIKNVDVSGASAVPKEKIQQFAAQELSGGYLYLFARSNVFLYPRAGLSRDLLAAFPALKAVQVHAENFHTIAVAVVERDPAALWCGEEEASSSSCFLLDTDGVVYAPAVIYSGDAYHKYYGAVGSETLPKQYLTQSQFSALAALVAALEGKVGDHIESVYVDTNSDAHTTFSSGFVLLFSLADDSGSVFERFSLALTADPFKTRKLTDFAYLDLRFGDKLYYKLR